MSAWTAKRFWTEVTVAEQGAGFVVQLDGRFVKTPAKADFVAPTKAIADAVAQEWRDVVEKIDPEVMPFTRSVNAAIDKVAVQFDDVAILLAAYGASDLLCYRADSPAGLVARQAEGWDPLLDWATKTYGCTLATTVGIMPIDQTPSDLDRLSRPLFEATAFELTALHDLIAMSGSLVLALGVTQRRLDAKTAWALSRIDETWQAEQWGEDDEAAQMAEIKRLSFIHAANFYHLTREHAGKASR